jgi:hypothetical protein
MTVTNVHKDPEQLTLTMTVELDTTSPHTSHRSTP